MTPDNLSGSCPNLSGAGSDKPPSPFPFGKGGLLSGCPELSGEGAMTKPKQASTNGLTPHYKVRIVLPGVLLHVASWTEPCLPADHRAPVVADWITDPAYGDTIGFIAWDHVIAVTWRFAA
jgi:hypothetical protein